MLIIVIIVAIMPVIMMSIIVIMSMPVVATVEIISVKVIKPMIEIVWPVDRCIKDGIARIDIIITGVAKTKPDTDVHVTGAGLIEWQH